MDTKSIATKLRNLCKDQSNRNYIIPSEKNSPPGLDLFLQSNDQEVVLIGIEIVYLLSQEKQNREKLRNATFEVELIKKHSLNSNIQSKANEVLNLLFENNENKSTNTQDCSTSTTNKEKVLSRKVFFNKDKHSIFIHLQRKRDFHQNRNTKTNQYLHFIHKPITKRKSIFNRKEDSQHTRNYFF
eukprot:TRINITY_DN6887_c1_g1_i1.p1 TRINITY_DN6887_c1_g1~~TRINITY_DN6887_c1_g1_i1.p1  ORF type:complete len:185 (-),score=36.75 TRINITY_DN6887_c1_g1_i1:400-954(-)